MTLFRTLLLLCAGGLCAGAASGWLWRTSGRETGEGRTTFIPILPPLPVMAADALAGADAVECRRLILAHLKTPGITPDALQIQVIFMRWLEIEEDLWPGFEELIIQSPESEALLTRAFFTAWAWHDCEAAGSRAIGSKYGGTAVVWEVACAQRHEQAVDLAPHVSNPDPKVLERLAGRDPELALKVVEKLPASTTGMFAGKPSPVLSALVRGWIKRSPEEALTWAIEAGREALFQQACLAWHRHDPGAFSSLDGLLKEKAQTDPVVAALFSEGAKVSPWHAAEAALSQNPCATLADIVALFKPVSLPGAASVPGSNLMPAVSNWEPEDPRAALVDVMALPDSTLRKYLAAQLVAAWRRLEPDKAEAWAQEQGLPASRIQDGRAEMTATENLPPAEAVTKLLAMPGAQTTNALSNAVSRMVTADPAQAAALLQAHVTKCEYAGAGPDGVNWSMILHNAAFTWSSGNLPEVTAWVNTLPPGPARDAAAGGMSQALKDYDPEAAFTWMATMKYPDSGSANMKAVLARIKYAAGEPAARRAVEMSPLPDTTKQELLNAL